MGKPAVDPKRTGLKVASTVFADIDVGDTAEPGLIEAKFDAGYIILSCPGCGHVSGMRVGNPKPEQTPSWRIAAGDTAETLTLEPSINCIGCCGWHGYLRDGVFESC